jgi:hypothetical protein
MNPLSHMNNLMTTQNFAGASPTKAKNTTATAARERRTRKQRQRATRVTFANSI